MLLLFPAVFLIYVWLYLKKISPLYKKLGIPAFLDGYLEFEVSKVDFENIPERINRNSNYITRVGKYESTFIRTNHEDILFKGERFKILPVKVELSNLSGGLVKVRLTTFFGFSFIDHHRRYFLVKQELLGLV